MKNKILIASMAGSLFLSSFALSNVVADELTWLNTHDFIAGENVMLSYSAPYYPGSIAVRLLDTLALPSEQEDDEIVTGDGILSRFQVRENYELNSISICLRDFDSAPPFAINIYKLGVPSEPLTYSATLDDVVTDELLTVPVPPEYAGSFCTEVSLTNPIQATGETLLLNVSFDFVTAPDAVAVISAIGLGEESTLLMIEDCNTEVPNLDIEGISLSESIDTCAEEAKNHGKFVSCVTKMANDLKKEGIISGREKGKITRCASKSDLP